MQSRNIIDERREAVELYWELLNARPHMRRSLQNLNNYLKANEAKLAKPATNNNTEPKKFKILV